MKRVQYVCSSTVYETVELLIPDEDDPSEHDADVIESEITEVDVENCNTCGDTGRWESTTEEEPTTLIDLGPCPDCDINQPTTKGNQ